MILRRASARDFEESARRSRMKNLERHHQRGLELSAALSREGKKTAISDPSRPTAFCSTPKPV
jgi:hypothetical protein